MDVRTEETRRVLKVSLCTIIYDKAKRNIHIQMNNRNMQIYQRLRVNFGFWNLAETTLVFFVFLFFGGFFCWISVCAINTEV